MSALRFAVPVLAAVLWGVQWAGVASAAEIELDGARGIMDAELRQDTVRVRLFYSDRPAQSDWPRAPSMELYIDGVRVSAIDDGGNGFEWPHALVQVVEMDKSNPYPEIVFATYSGGAHCCNMRRILTSSPDGSSWSIIEPGPIDGDIAGVRDEDFDGLYEIVHPDNDFYYTFSSYAGSFAPLKVFALKSGRLVDVSADKRFEELHRKTLRDIEPTIRTIRTQHEKNGLLAGYVALKMLLGEGQEAWRLMRGHYDRKSDWGLKQCTGGYDADRNCLRETAYRTFPDALKAFLRERGYWR